MIFSYVGELFSSTCNFSGVAGMGIRRIAAIDGTDCIVSGDPSAHLPRNSEKKYFFRLENYKIQPLI